MFRKYLRYVLPWHAAQQNFTGVQEHTHQHPGMAAMKHPLFPVSGQEPVPCHPLVPSLPKDQSLGSSEPTQKETGGVFFMQVLPGTMLDESYRAGSIAASVVRSACVVPLGISHSLRQVGAGCVHHMAPVHKLTQDLQNRPQWGVDS